MAPPRCTRYTPVGGNPRGSRRSFEISAPWILESPRDLSIEPREQPLQTRSTVGDERRLTPRCIEESVPRSRPGVLRCRPFGTGGGT